MKLTGKCCFFSHYICKQDRMIAQDIRILKELGFAVTATDKFRQIPWHCDLYFSWWASGSILPFIKAFLSRKPIIVVAGGSEAIHAQDSVSQVPFGYLAYPWYKRLATRISLRFSNVVLLVSKFMLKDARVMNIGNPLVVYNGVDTNIFKPDDSPRSAITIVFHQQESVVMIKRGEVFLRSVPLILKKYPEQRFIVLGERGGAFERIDGLSKDLQIEHSVEFAGLIHFEQIPQILRQSKIYVQISDSETFGMSVAEAMASGTPIVVSRRGALPEVAGDVGIYVDHNDPISVADGIINLLNKSEDERREIGIRARKRIIDNFSYERRKKAIQQVINNL